MIDISPEAQAYFRQLIERQGVGELGLRLKVLSPGTPRASCDLQFWPEDQRLDEDQRYAYDGFELFVPPDSSAWLSEAEIDFETDDAGGQLTIKAPNIKGAMPADDAPLAARVAWLIDAEINPQLASHGGRVALETITDDGEAVLRFGGGCHGCGMADVTLKQGIEKTLREAFPEISGVLDATDHASGENPYYAPRS